MKLLARYPILSTTIISFLVGVAPLRGGSHRVLDESVNPNTASYGCYIDVGPSPQCFGIVVICAIYTRSCEDSCADQAAHLISIGVLESDEGGEFYSRCASDCSDIGACVENLFH